LGTIAPEPTPDEVAAIVAAFTVVERERAAAAAAAEPRPRPDDWLRVSRARARRLGAQRGPWRLSGRLGRRPSA